MCLWRKKSTYKILTLYRIFVSVFRPILVTTEDSGRKGDKSYCNGRVKELKRRLMAAGLLSGNTQRLP